jgi:branched-chain amino acid transport system substrate-binding protein
VIGGDYALTGPFAVLGAEEAQGAQAYAKWIDAHGGVLGRQVQLKTLDDQSSPQVAASNVSELVSRYHAVAIAGPEEISTTGGAASIGAQLNVPVMSSDANWPYGLVLTSGEKNVTYLGLPPTTRGADEYLQYFEQHHITRVAIIGAKTTFLQGLVEYFQSLGKSLPIKIVADVSFTPGATSITPQILQVENSKPQFILGWGIGSDEVTLAKAIKSMGVTIPFGMAGGGTNPTFTDAAGDSSLQGVYAFAFASQFINDLPNYPTQAAVHQYLTGMTQAGFNSQGGSSNAVMGWDNVLQLVAAIKAAKSADPSAINNALQHLNVTDALAVWHRTPSNHGATPVSAGQPNGYVLVQFNGNNWDLVER